MSLTGDEFVTILTAENKDARVVAEAVKKIQASLALLKEGCDLLEQAGGADESKDGGSRSLTASQRAIDAHVQSTEGLDIQEMQERVNDIKPVAKQRAAAYGLVIGARTALAKMAELNSKAFPLVFSLADKKCVDLEWALGTLKMLRARVDERSAANGKQLEHDAEIEELTTQMTDLQAQNDELADTLKDTATLLSKCNAVMAKKVLKPTAGKENKEADSAAGATTSGDC